MSNNVLANMSIKLSAETQAFAAGMKNAQGRLIQFQGTADKLKGVNLNSLKVSFDRQISSLSSLQKAAREYGKALRHATDEKEIKALNAALEQTQVEMARIKNLGRTGLTGITSSSNSATKGMNNLAGSAGQVNMEFARIIQDAPYGMMGIGNNIQQLTANFGQLQKQAGSTKVALGAALSSLMTPAAALTIGIAALTTGWTLYEKWQQKATKAAKEGADALKEGEQSADDYIKTLNKLTQARAKGGQEAQKELTTLGVLYRQTQNAALSIRDRKKAVDELQRIYPSYFGNLSDEEILTGKASEAYNKLSKSLLATAKARAAMDLITENAKKQHLNDIKALEIQEEIEKKKKSIAALENAGRTNTGGGNLGSAGLSSDVGFYAKIKETQDEITAKEKEIKTLRSENSKIQAVSLNLEKQINAEIANGGSIIAENGAKLKENLKTLQEIQRASTATIKPLETKQGAEVQNSGTMGDPAAVAAGFDLIPLAIGRASEAQTLFFQNMYAEAEKAKEQALMIADAVGAVAGSAFSSLGEGLAGMFTGMETGIGVLQNVGKALLAAVNDFAKAFGQRLLAIGAGELLMGIPTGALKVAAGAGLITLSSLGSSMASAGSGSTPSLSSGSGYQAPRPTYNAPQKSGPQELVAKISGRELQILMQNESAFTKRFGG